MEDTFIDYVGFVVHGDTESMELDDIWKEQFLKAKSLKDENNLTGTHVILAFTMISSSKLKIYGMGENKVVRKGPLMIGFVILVYIA